MPNDAEKIEQLFVFVGKGLMWHHWGVLIGPDDNVQVHRRGDVDHMIYEQPSWKQVRRERNPAYTIHREGAQGIERRSRCGIFDYGGLSKRQSPFERSPSGAMIGPRRISASDRVKAGSDERLNGA